MRRYGITSFLGGYKVLGKRIGSSFDLHDLILKGIPVGSADHLKETLGLTDKELADFLAISTSTLRRKRRSSGRLSLIAGDRLYRLARGGSLAIEVMGHKGAVEWLRTPQKGLNEKVPFDLLCFYPGAREVEEFLLRMWEDTGKKPRILKSLQI